MLSAARKSVAVDFEDKREYDEEDVENALAAVVNLQDKMSRLDNKQTRTAIRLNEELPVGIAFWGDWHVGGFGTDYKQLDQDVNKIRDTDGLYSVGTGDYKDNYVLGSPPGGKFEQIMQPGMQDIAVGRHMEQVAGKMLALIRGCHDDWDKKSGDRDFVEHLCHITNSVNLWHGGELTIKLGDQEYLIRARHKYKYQSSLNLENAMRRINEIQGPCDIAVEGHWHEGYVMHRHLMGLDRIMLRAGSYKVWDEYGQKLAGYEGKPMVPVVIIRPDFRSIQVELFLDRGIETLNNLRRR